MLTPGRRLDRYELVRPVARGGMGEIWLGRLKGAHAFEKWVAVKTILPELSRDRAFQEKFVREARLAVCIDHPNVAQVLDLGEADGTLYLVMEWVDGHPLDRVAARFRARGERVPLGLALRVVADAAAGLHAAHEARDAEGNALGIVHCDVSPQNVLLTERGVVKLIDFGIARARRAGAGAGAGAGAVEDEVSIRGKAAYMSPEQATAGAVDARTDVWALGAVLYELVSGTAPVRDLAQLARLLDGRDRIAPLGVTAVLDAIAQRALALDAAARFPDARAMQAAIDAAAAAMGVSAAAADVAEMIARLEPRALMPMERAPTEVADSSPMPVRVVVVAEDGDHVAADAMVSRLRAAGRSAERVQRGEEPAPSTIDACLLVEAWALERLAAQETGTPPVCRVAVCDDPTTTVACAYLAAGRIDGIVARSAEGEALLAGIDAAVARRARRAASGGGHTGEREAQVLEEARMRGLLDRYERRLDVLRRRVSEADNDARISPVGELELRRARLVASPVAVAVYRTRRPELVTPSNDLAALLASVRSGSATFTEDRGEVVLVAPGESGDALRAVLSQRRFVAGSVVVTDPVGDESFATTVARARSEVP